MSVALADKTELRIPAPELRGASWEVGACRDTEVCLDGPGGCVAGETLFYNPVTGEHTPIKELYKKRIAPIVQTLMGAIQADVPFRKGVERLYRVTLASGRQCIVTANHRVLTPKGWRFVSDLSLGDLVGVGEPNVLPSYALHSRHTNANFQSDCLSGSHQCGERPLQVGDSGLYELPSQDGVPSQSLSDLHMDDREHEPLYIHLAYSHHASKDYSHRPEYRAFVQSGAFSGSGVNLCEKFLPVEQSHSQMFPALLTHKLDQYGHNTYLNASCLTQFPQLLEHSEPVLARNQAYQTFDECLMSADRSQEPVNVGPLLTAYTPSKSSPIPYNTTSVPYNNTSWDTVSSIEYERTDEYFDLHVPFAEHYLAEGIWHHNTGKTYGILYKIHTLLLSYPGAKWLVCRKFNVDLAGSAMATYQNDVLHPSENVIYYGGSKVKPAGYNYPNGSFLAVSGLDRPSKLKSFECDGVYINEATEVDIDDLEIARMRLRKGVIPYQQVLMDTNPDAPTHWLNARMNEGRTTRLISRHEDNPRYWNNRTQDWTEEGRKYIFGILGGLTGVRYARYRLGLWVAAEGTVYEDSWDRARNVIDRFPIPKEWPRYLCVDFGYTNPFVCKWYAMDPDGRLFCYREIYHTKRLVEDHAKQIKHYSRWGLEGGDPLPREIICDHDAEDRATLERHLGLITRPAHKTVRDGIQATAARYRNAGDGKPRLMHFRDALVERDPELSRQKKPTCTIEEPESYVWAETNAGIKEEPVKENDHGLDCDRYIVARFDLKPTTVRYSQRVY